MHKKLQTIASVESGGTPSRSNLAYWGGSIPWVKISDMKGPYVDFTEERITQEGFDNSSAKLFPPGTILYSIFATLGETSVLNIPASTNQAIAGIQITDRNINPKFLYYFFKSTKRTISAKGRGAAQQNINLTILRNLEIPYLKPLQQEEIVKELDLITNLIQEKESNLFLLNDLVKSRFRGEARA